MKALSRMLAFLAWLPRNDHQRCPGSRGVALGPALKRTPRSARGHRTFSTSRGGCALIPRRELRGLGGLGAIFPIVTQERSSLWF